MASAGPLQMVEINGETKLSLTPRAQWSFVCTLVVASIGIFAFVMQYDRRIGVLEKAIALSEQRLANAEAVLAEHSRAIQANQDLLYRVLYERAAPNQRKDSP